MMPSSAGAWPKPWSFDYDAMLAEYLGYADQISWLDMFIVALAGTILGLLATALIHRHFIVDAALEFPTGNAAAQTLRATEAGGMRYINIPDLSSEIHTKYFCHFQYLPVRLSYSLKDICIYHRQNHKKGNKN